MSPLTRLASLALFLLPLTAASTATSIEGRWVDGRTETWTRDDE